jgi:hypothetical protein
LSLPVAVVKNFEERQAMIVPADKIEEKKPVVIVLLNVNILNLGLNQIKRVSKAIPLVTNTKLTSSLRSKMSN